MQNEMRGRLEQMVIDAEINWQNSTRSFSSVCADHLIENGVIVLPCKVGDYIEWDRGGGIGKTLYQVKGFLYYENSLRYVLDFFEPVVTHQAITGILTKEEAEQKLKGGADNE